MPANLAARPVAPDAPELVAALEAADLPTEDLSDRGRVFLAFEDAGRLIGFGGFEQYGKDTLLRSVVVLPEARGQGFGRAVTEAVLAHAHEAGARRAYLLTTTAESFFEHEGFVRIERSDAPAAILGTKQATTICSTAGSSPDRFVGMVDLTRRLAAEALGTGLLVATVVGSGIMAERLTHDGALALLANTLPTGAILVVLVTVLAPISGAHLNPAVTLVMALRRALPTRDAALYVVAQLIGAVIGTMLAHSMFAVPLLEVSQHVRSGPTQWLAETVATFGLVSVVLGGIRFQPIAVPWLCGLYITAAYWFTASTSFANPAVTIARALTDTFSGIRPIDAPGFIGAQLAGALVACVLAGWLWAPSKEQA